MQHIYGIGKAVIALLLILSNTVSADERLQLKAISVKGEPLEEVVFYAMPRDLDLIKQASSELDNNGLIEIDQKNKQFVGLVHPVFINSNIDFPNHDVIRHHVYSFSKAKTFEIPLYKDRPPAPILFDKPGEVALGCNIHDWMQAYIYVLETPFFVKSDQNGEAELILPDSKAGYDILAWHPSMKNAPEDIAQTLSNTTMPIIFEIEQKRLWRPVRGPSSSHPSNRSY